MKNILFSSSMNMKVTIMNVLLNRISVAKYVNLNFNGCIIENNIVKKIIENIKGEVDRFYIIDVNISNLPRLKRKKTLSFVNIINNDLSRQKFDHWIHKALSIDDALLQLSGNLSKPCLLIIHQFMDKSSKSEKQILESIRKYIEDPEKSLFLLILILSSHRIDEWVLPDSDLDERHVEYFSPEIKYE